MCELANGVVIRSRSRDAKDVVSQVCFINIVSAGRADGWLVSA